MTGKTVSVTGAESILTGVVEKVKFSNGFATLMIGGKDYYLNDVQSIGEEPNEHTGEYRYKES